MSKSTPIIRVASFKIYGVHFTTMDYDNNKHYYINHNPVTEKKYEITLKDLADRPLYIVTATQLEKQNVSS